MNKPELPLVTCMLKNIYSFEFFIVFLPYVRYNLITLLVGFETYVSCTDTSFFIYATEFNNIYCRTGSNALHVPKNFTNDNSSLTWKEFPWEKYGEFPDTAKRFVFK